MTTSSAILRRSISIQAQLNRTREIHQRLHHAVQSLNLAANHIQMAARIRINFLHLLAQHFQVHNNGVDGIFYFMRHA